MFVYLFIVHVIVIITIEIHSWVITLCVQRYHTTLIVIEMSDLIYIIYIIPTYYQHVIIITSS